MKMQSASGRKAFSMVGVIVAVVVAALAVYLIIGMVARTRQHERDKAARAPAAPTPSPAPSPAWPLSVRIIKAADTWTVKQDAACEVEVKNLSNARLAVSGDTVYAVGSYFAPDAAQEMSFTTSIGIPKDLEAGETCIISLPCHPQAPLKDGYLVVRVYANRKPQGQWASAPASQMVTVK